MLFYKLFEQNGTTTTLSASREGAERGQTEAKLNDENGGITVVRLAVSVCIEELRRNIYRYLMQHYN